MPGSLLCSLPFHALVNTTCHPGTEERLSPFPLLRKLRLQELRFSRLEPVTGVGWELLAHPAPEVASVGMGEGGHFLRQEGCQEAKLRLFPSLLTPCPVLHPQCLTSLPEMPFTRAPLCKSGERKKKTLVHSLAVSWAQGLA